MSRRRTLSIFSFNLPKALVFMLSVLLISISFSEGGRTPVRAKNGMVSSASKLATEVGVETLKQGGNAVDAAVATAFALAVTWPSAGNIGGGGFLVYHGDNGHATSFDFREKAPIAATEEMYLGVDGRVVNNSNHIGILAIGYEANILAVRFVGNSKAETLCLFPCFIFCQAPQGEAEKIQLILRCGEQKRTLIFVMIRTPVKFHAIRPGHAPDVMARCQCVRLQVPRARQKISKFYRLIAFYTRDRCFTG